MFPQHDPRPMWGPQVVSTVPTVGFNVETVEYRNINFTVWDAGMCSSFMGNDGCDLLKMKVNDG